MGSKVYFFVMVILSLHVLSCAFPRDNTAFQNQHEGLPKEDSVVSQKAKNSAKAVPEPTIPGRIHCQYEEVTEDIICQEHCTLKGYSYGLCISKTCSCI